MQPLLNASKASEPSIKHTKNKLIPVTEVDELKTNSLVK